MPFPSDIPSQISFVSFLQYATKIDSAAAKSSRQLVNAIKNDSYYNGSRVIDSIAQRLKDVMSIYPVLAECFPPGSTLVPMPRSSPFPATGVGKLATPPLWPGKRLCDAMVAAGVAQATYPLLRRAVSVSKSAFSPPNLRPKAEMHYDSFQVDKQFVTGMRHIIIVDDIVTRGATFFAAYLRLAEAFSDIGISCFAAVRTRSGEDIATLRDPVKGTITLHQGDTFRRP